MTSEPDSTDLAKAALNMALTDVKTDRQLWATIAIAHALIAIAEQQQADT